ncbi:MAG: ATP-binding cassette domain-containing protein, partial [Sphingobacteriales bacterium]
MEPILKVNNLSKTYRSADETLTVLENINFSLDAGSTMALVGPSGSGKTTLLGLCAGLDSSSTGSMYQPNVNVVGRRTSTDGQQLQPVQRPAIH